MAKKEVAVYESDYDFNIVYHINACGMDASISGANGVCPEYCRSALVG